MTTVAVYSYTQSVTYVADNILKSLKDIIKLSGLSPQALIGDWEVLLRGISRWIESGHLETVTLEIYNPKTGQLLTRWDIDVSYTWSSEAGNFWTDTEQLKYALKKSGILPNQAEYSVLVHNKPGRPEVDGWGNGTYRCTSGMIRQSLGGTIEHNGLGANTSYWRTIS